MSFLPKLLALLTLVSSNAIALDEKKTIVVRKFSLLTGVGENVLHKDFDRRRLTEDFDHLSLDFNAENRDVSFFRFRVLTFFLFFYTCILPISTTFIR